jgi:hypothetical protein
LAGFDLIAFTGAPAATSPFFMGESLEDARVALRCDNPLIQVRAAASNVGIVEAAWFLGDSSPESGPCLAQRSAGTTRSVADHASGHAARRAHQSRLECDY